MEIMFSMLIFLMLLIPMMNVQSTNMKMVSRAHADAQAANLLKSETDSLSFEPYDKLESYSKYYDDQGTLTSGSWSSSDQQSLVKEDTTFAGKRWGGGTHRYILTVNVEEMSGGVKKLKKIDITVFVKSNLLGYIKYRGYIERTKPEEIPGMQ